MLTKYNDIFDFNELGKLAIDYSDGVIAAHKNANKDLIKYAKDNNVPVLAYPGEDFAQAYEEFYEKI
jgi:starch synthase